MSFAELNTAEYISFDGGGDGRVEGDMTGVGKVTLYDGEGGDMWDGGNQNIFLYDSTKVTGDFTATARVAAQGGFEIGLTNSAGEIQNNVFPEADAGVIDPTTNVSWVRLQYKADTNTPGSFVVRR